MRGIMTETISRVMFARRARDTEEPQVTTTAGETPAPEGA